MRGIRRRLPSPALVVAMLALAAALAGTGYATGFRLPANSVTTREVKNGSLLRVDFRAGQLPSGGGTTSSGPQCATGFVRALAHVNGSLTFADQFTSNGVDNVFNCGGGGAQARRVAAGVYDVRFPGNTGVYVLAQTNGANASPSGPNHNTFITWERSGDAFTIYEHDADGTLVDTSFVIALF
jgi:hypothetical protein